MEAYQADLEAVYEIEEALGDERTHIPLDREAIRGGEDLRRLGQEALLLPRKDVSQLMPLPS